MARTFPNNAANYMSQSARHPPLDWFNEAADGSFHMWVKLAGTSGDQTFAAQYPVSSRGVLARLNSGKLGVFWVDAAVGGQEAISAASFTTGEWTPIGFTYDSGSGTTQAYMKGAADGSDSGTVAGLSAAWHLGVRSGGANPLNGDVGDVCMWPGLKLSAAQYAALAAGAPPEKVEPRNLIRWPIHGLASPEPSFTTDRRNATFPFAVTGTLSPASHPPVGKNKQGGTWEKWVEQINEDGSTLTNWTTDSGTWSITGGVIRCAAVSATGRLVHNTTLTPSWLGEWEMEVRVSSTSVQNNGRGAIITRWDGSGTGAPLVRLLWRTSASERCEIEQDSVAGITGVDFAWSLDTWYKITVRESKFMYAAYVDDVLQFTSLATPDATNNRLGLMAGNANVDFRNIVYRGRAL